MFVETVTRNETRYCVYCGDWFECGDHLVPIDWPGNHRSYSIGEVVTVCQECSSLLSHCSKPTLSSRAGYLTRAYEKRAAKWLRVPPWSEQELQEMGYDNAKSDPRSPDFTISLYIKTQESRSE
jgi:hypothetical protein